nr:hypothetical protein [Pelagicoccus enzymogenes]
MDPPSQATGRTVSRNRLTAPSRIRNQKASGIRTTQHTGDLPRSMPIDQDAPHLAIAKKVVNLPKH